MMVIPEPRSPQEAVQLQEQMRSLLILKDEFKSINTIAGVDVGYDLRLNLSKAAVTLMTYDNLELQESVIAFAPTPFPYIPGLLSFREAPVILKALSCLSVQPDLLIVDGHGIAHPRRVGIAAHMGLLTEIPALGAAKSRLCGVYKEPGMEKGASSILTHRKETIGTVLRSRDNTKPLFISPGHKISHESAVTVVRKCLARYRLPEPTRIADKLSKFSS